MTPTDNPYEGPRSQHSRARGIGRDVLARLSFLLGSILCFFIGPTVLNGLVPSQQTPRNIEIASLGGLTFLIAFWSIFLGWLLLLLGYRRIAVIVAAAGLASVVALPLAVRDLTDYQRPALWAWIVAYAILAMGGMRNSRASAAH
jgi:hypothetical protein